MKTYIKQLFIAGLFALATLSAIAPTHAQSGDAEAQAAALQERITAAIEAEDYNDAKALFNQYEPLVGEMPLPMLWTRAMVYERLGQFYQAELRLNEYLRRVERNRSRAMAALAEITPKADDDPAKARVEAEAEAFAEQMGMPLSVTATGGEHNSTLLHFAASEGHIEIAEWLLVNGADAGAKDSEGNTPLALAVLNGHEDIEHLVTPSTKCSELPPLPSPVERPCML